MRCDKCGKRPERYYPANQSDTPGFVRTFLCPGPAACNGLVFDISSVLPDLTMARVIAPLDCPLKMPKLYFKLVERVSGVLDFGNCERSMLIFIRPFDARSNRDRVCFLVELPPHSMCKQVTLAEK